MSLNIINKLKFKIKTNDLFGRITNGLFWVTIGNVSSKFLMLLSFVFVARNIGKEAYGELGIVRSTLTMFFTLASLGLGMTASKYISIYRLSEKNKVLKIFKFSSYSSLFFGVVFSTFLFLSSEYVANKSLSNDNLEVLLKLGSISILFNAINSTFSGTLIGLEDFKTNGLVNLFSGLIQFLLIIIGLYLYDSIGVILALSINSLITFIIYLLLLLKKHSFDLNFKRNEVFDHETKQIFLNFSLPSVFLSLLQLPVLWFVKLILTRQAGFGALADFDVAEQWYMILLFLPNTINSILLPILSSLNVSQKENDFSKVLKLSLILNFSLTLLFTIFIYFLSPYVFSFYGNEFTNFETLNIMSIATIFSSLSNVFVQIFASKGKMWFGFMTNIFWAVVLISFSVYFINYLKFGSLGLAYSMVISNVLLFIVQFLSYKFIYNTLK